MFWLIFSSFSPSGDSVGLQKLWLSSVAWCPCLFRGWHLENILCKFCPHGSKCTRAQQCPRWIGSACCCWVTYLNDPVVDMKHETFLQFVIRTLPNKNCCSSGKIEFTLSLPLSPNLSNCQQPAFWKKLDIVLLYFFFQCDHGQFFCLCYEDIWTFFEV